MKLSAEEQLKIITKGCKDVLPEGDLLAKIKKSIKTSTPLKIKLGVDPTGTDIHLGHTVILQRMKAFQDCGHDVVFLIGDYTGMIGDPSGRSSTRRMLSQEELLKNSEQYKDQVTKILDPKKTQFQYNSEWLSQLDFKELIAMASQVTVAQLIERDDFYKRYTHKEPISLVEFIYPLMQGYDSVAMKCDVELGGQDQLFNLLMGRVLQKYYGQSPQVVMTVPLLEGTDGVRKMSKSFNNIIGIDESAKDIFGKVMSIPDSLMWNYFNLLTDFSIDHIDQLKIMMENGKNPRDIKLELAKAIVTNLKGQDIAEQSRQEFLTVFSDRSDIPTDTKEIIINKAFLLMDLILQENLVSSKSEVKRLFQQNAISLNGNKVIDPYFLLDQTGDHILKIGKTRFLKIKF